MSPRQRQVRELLLSIDRGPGVKVGRQIEVQLRERISSGLLPIGTALPSTRVLAEEMAVSRGVVGRAYRQLAAEGYIVLRQGANPRVKGFPARVEVPAQRRNGSAVKYRLDLRPDLPDLASFPRVSWLRAQQRALQSASTLDVANTDGAGLWALRKELAAYLGRSRGVLVRPEALVVTAGTSQSLALVARALAVDGLAEVGFENPSCALHHAAVREVGSEPRGVRIDEQGLIVSELHDAGIRAVVVSSTDQFPTGTRLSEPRRAALIEWATETGGLIIETDSELREDNAQPPMQTAAPARVVYVGSTQKTLGPFAPLGWAVLPDHLVPSVQKLSAFLHVSSFDQLAFGDFLARGDYDRHMLKMRVAYRHRRAVLVDALREAFPRLAIVEPLAGLHVVLLTEPDGLAGTVCAVARKRGVAVDSLCEHTLPGYDGPEGLLVGFGQVSEATVPAAVDELRRAFAAAMSSAPARSTLRRAAS
jgi:GntR family transcriptional regulator/MocR family aminotransferase